MTRCREMDELDGDFSHYDHDPKGPDIVRGHCVYRTPKADYNDRPPLVLLHELYGLSQPCVDFARRLEGDGFGVHLPVIFGKPLPENGRDRGANAFRMCIGREFTLLRKHKTSPVTAWVRSLVAAVASQHKESRVGVVGMCLTAHVVFPLVVDVKVGAVVASQSAMPWTWPISTSARKRSLGMSRSDYLAIKNAESGLAAVGAVRFRGDPTSPCQRMVTVRDYFGSPWIRTVSDPNRDRGFALLKPHAVFTDEYDNSEGSDTRVAYKQLVAFLKDNV